ncbi:hypothetical protein [Pontibacter sp. G13]|uniref:hypothetical protein n=1 Tax=Pontibacter sp. G13 TaxID=3074898 RepID=UPI0028893324|nr:hypothetical protein [Pontibacter sp. G13]WNJ18248.1 hypothetical protein RJD25_25635 [Pontibacter sp. G13]
MKRRIQTYGKNGVLEIVGNPQETILYLKSRPIQYSWYAEVGSTWRFHIAQGLKKQVVRLYSRIEETLQRGIGNEGDFLAITEYFNQFLCYGTYEFGYYELCEDLTWVDVPESEEYESYDYYGGSVGISPTQNFIDDKIVENYKEQILRGSRPVLVLLHVENSWMFYILDGHHKFLAYRRAKVKPHAIIITKVGNEYRSISNTLELAGKMGCTKQGYLNWMSKEKKNLEYYKNQTLDLEVEFKRIEN